MPTLYLKIKNSFEIKQRPTESVNIIEKFSKSNYKYIYLRLKGIDPCFTSFGFSLSEEDIVEGELKIIKREKAVEVDINAIFKISAKTEAINFAFDENSRWYFHDLLSTDNAYLNGQISGLEFDNFKAGPNLVPAYKLNAQTSTKKLDLKVDLRTQSAVALFYHIYFNKGISEASECWSLGYMNNSTCSPLNKILVSKENNLYQLLDVEFADEKRNIDLPNTVLVDANTFSTNLSKIFSVSKSEANIILALSLFADKKKTLEKSGHLIYNKGGDYGGEINIEQNQQIVNFKETLIYAFTSVQEELYSGSFRDEEEIAAIYYTS